MSCCCCCCCCQWKLLQCLFQEKKRKKASKSAAFNFPFSLDSCSCSCSCSCWSIEPRIKGRIKNRRRKTTAAAAAAALKTSGKESWAFSERGREETQDGRKWLKQNGQNFFSGQIWAKNHSYVCWMENNETWDEVSSPPPLPPLFFQRGTLEIKVFVSCIH